MQNVALITGASGGIGAELARIHAKHGDLVLVARSEDKLQSLKTELGDKHGCTIVVLAKDLTRPEAPQEIFDVCQQQGIAVDILMNNAGFGGHGRFVEREIERDFAMVDLNCKALLHLTHLFLPSMIERGSGTIFNTASTAAFAPGPLQATYFATKAFVLNFSEALAEELKGTDVSVTALCPGPVDTGFAKTGNLEGTPGFQRMATPQKVAAAGYRGMQKGKLIVFDSWFYAFTALFLLRFMPRWFVVRMSRRMMSKEG